MNQVNLRIEPLDFQTEEAYKALRANLQFCGADKKAIVLTSCTPNEAAGIVSGKVRKEDRIDRCGYAQIRSAGRCL